MLSDLWRSQVVAALGSLQPIDREAVVLVYFKRYSYAEAASRMGVTYAAVAGGIRAGLGAVSLAVESGTVDHGSVA